MFGRRIQKSRKPRKPSFPLGVEPLENRRMLATIAGSVFHDANADGNFSGDDTGLAGIVVELDGIDNRNRPVNLTTTTDTFGTYEFTNLRRGTYSLTAAQSPDFLDGIDVAGSGGGTVGDDTIESIFVRNNDVVTDYLFGEISAAELGGSIYRDLDRDGNFDAGDTPLDNVMVTLTGVDDLGASVSQQQPSASDGAYLFNNLRPGEYQIEATTPAGLTDGRETIGRFAGNSHAVAENGQSFNDRFERIMLAAGQQGRNYNFGEFDEAVTAGVLATTFDTTLVFDGTSAADTFEFIGGTAEHTVILNGQSTVIDATANTQIIFYGHSGSDAASLTGGPGIDQVELRETSAKLTGVSYQVLVYTTHHTTAQSGGGEDRALFYDTTGDDDFSAGPLGASLTGTGYEHIAHDFHRVYAYASEGNDSATLDGSNGNDRYKATDSDARLYGSGFYNYVRGFDVVHGDAKSGTDDRAYLYDSDGRDVYDSTANESRFYGTTFDNHAHGFDRVYAYASDTNDIAIFRDSGGSDYYKVDSAGARLYGDTYYNRAIGFGVHYTLLDASDGETDRVSFEDSADDDTFAATGNRFIAVRGNSVHYVWNPDIVLAQATVGHNRAYLYSFNFELRMEGDWDTYRQNPSNSTVNQQADSGSR